MKLDDLKTKDNDKIYDLADNIRETLSLLTDNILFNSPEFVEKDIVDIENNLNEIKKIIKII